MKTATASRDQEHQTMGEPYNIKTSGYLVSTLSVILLAIPAWKNASTNPLLMFCLAGGMIASMAGMALRWWSYRLEKSRTNAPASTQNQRALHKGTAPSGQPAASSSLVGQDAMR